MWPDVYFAWEAGTYFTDASGGADSQNRDLRRCALAVVRLEDGAGARRALHDSGVLMLYRPKCWAVANLEGSLQTINRAELAADDLTLELVRPTEGGVTVVFTDSQSVCSGAGLPRTALVVGCNGDLWTRWHDLVSNKHQFRVRVRKVKAHLQVADVRVGAVTVEEFV